MHHLPIEPTIDKQPTYIRYFESFMRSNSSVAIVPMVTANWSIRKKNCDFAKLLTRYRQLHNYIVAIIYFDVLNKFKYT